MAVNINVPSQVKTYANLAAFPATGALKTIYIAEDTNKTYRWTGSVYTEISASAAMTWGAIGGTLSNQTDLQSALDAKVPTSRTLTINGVTQDLSADRTFTISTGITIGTTGITSGAVGRILFQGAANTIQQNGNLFWDNTNSRLGLGTTSPSNTLHLASSASNTRINISNSNATPNTGLSFLSGSTSSWSIAAYGTNMNFTFYNDFLNADALFITRATNNIGINTTTDAGFRLDVNGTARVVGPTFAVGDWTQRSTSVYVRAATGGAENRGLYIGYGASNDGNGGSLTYQATTNMLNIRSPYNNGTIALSFEGNTNSVQFHNTSGTAVSKFFSGTGNLGINTTTDAGFRLDVNGTARVITSMLVGVSATQGVVQSGVFRGSFFNSYSNSHTIFEIKSSGNASFYQGAAFGTSSDAVASAQVEIVSTTKGFLPPRMTTTQKNAIASPAAGLMVYDTTLNVISYYNGSMWI